MPVSGQLDEGAALMISIGATAASWAMLLGGASAHSETAAGLGMIGTFLAPSAGHWYSGAVLTRGMGIRAIGAATTFLGVATAIGCDDGCNDDKAALLLIGGLLVYAAGTLDDIITAPLWVREHNRSLESLALAPMVARQSAGIALAGRF
jgi:hypothetical protein